MIDETNIPEGRPETGPGSSAGAGTERAGFCQQCGRVLSVQSLHRVGNGVFCEDCAAARTTPPGGGAWAPVNPAPGGNAYPGVPPGPAASDEPNPSLAGFLGLIPGVGAMYNGQYAKGGVHLIVFVVLIALADNLNWVFWWLVWGWIFYQAFEAYHTARARRDGLPLPNPFGWNELGDRLGFSRPWPQPGGPVASSGTVRGSAADWRSTNSPLGQAGTVPPTATGEAGVPYGSRAPFAGAAVADPPPPPYPPPAGTPYTQTYTGFPPSSTSTVPPPAMSQPIVALSARRFPVGAFWLIGLGTLFLLGNLLPEWRLSGRWLVPVLLAALALWTASRRYELMRANPVVAQASGGLAGTMLGPALLLSVAALLALQDASVLPLRRSWPVLLVIWGAMLFAQRASEASLPVSDAAGANPTPPASAAGSSTGPLGL